VLIVGSDGNVARKDVVTDAARNGDWIVTSGVAAGDQVIVSGIQRVKAGQPAKGTPCQPATPASQPGASATKGAATTTAHVPATQTPNGAAPKPASKENDKASGTPDKH